MQYFVIGPDGSKFGPADIATLRQWAFENRVTPQMALEDTATGQRIGAYQVEGIFDPQPQQTATMPGPGTYPGPGSMYENPPVPGQYPRAGAYYNDSSSELTWAFVLFGIGAFMCVLSPIVCSFGIAQANKAIVKGNPSGKIARTLNLILLIIGCLVWVFYIVLFTIGFATDFR